MNQAELLLLEKEYEINSNQVLKLVNVSGLSAYDCEYVALAKDLNIHLVTSDLAWRGTARSQNHQSFS